MTKPILPGLPTPVSPRTLASSANRGTHLDPARHAIVIPDGERTVFAMPLEDGRVGMIPVHPIIQGLPFEFQQDYARFYADAYQDALKEQGPSTFESSQLSAAIHETGHLIVAQVLGFRPIWARIWHASDIGGWAGFNECDPADTRQVGAVAELRQNNLTMACTNMAGYIAERVIEGENAKLGSSIDERVVSLILVTWANIRQGREATFRCLTETENRVARMIERNRASGQAIIDALMRLAPNKLEGKELARLLEGIRP